MDKKHLSLVIAVLCAATASADVTIRTVSEKDGAPWSVTYVSGGKVRAENLQGEAAAYVLWQSGSDVMTTVMPSRRSYMVMDRKVLAEQMKEVNAQMKEVEAQMAAMPPAVREMMKKNMPNMGTGKPLIEMKVTKTGKADKKAGYGCSMVDVAITGVPMAGPMGHEHCVVPNDQIKLPAGDLMTLKSMAAWAKELTKELGQVVGGMPDVMEMGGWPVWTRDKRTGEAWVLQVVERTPVDAALFTVPAGYTEEKMPSLGDPAAKPEGAKKKKKKKKD